MKLSDDMQFVQVCYHLSFQRIEEPLYIWSKLGIWWPDNGREVDLCLLENRDWIHFK
jgi:hypothetical protein